MAGLEIVEMTRGMRCKWCATIGMLDFQDRNPVFISCIRRINWYLRSESKADGEI